MSKNSRAFLIPALIGLLVAIFLGCLSRLEAIIFPDWIVYIWPTMLVLGGISGHASFVAEISAIAVSAFLNGMLYGIVGCFVYQIVRFMQAEGGKKSG